MHANKNLELIISFHIPTISLRRQLVLELIRNLQEILEFHTNAINNSNPLKIFICRLSLKIGNEEVILQISGGNLKFPGGEKMAFPPRKQPRINTG